MELANRNDHNAAWFIVAKTVPGQRNTFFRQGGATWRVIFRENDDGSCSANLNIDGQFYGGAMDNYFAGETNVAMVGFNGENTRISANGAASFFASTGNIKAVSDPMFLGGENLGEGRLDGEIYEALYFDHGPTEENLKKIEGYLAHKWGADSFLKADHPYKDTPPSEIQDTPTGQTAKVSGIVQIDGTPAERIVRAFGYNPTAHDLDGSTVNLSKSLGHATSDPQTGEYTIDLLGGYGKEIFVVAFDDYGQPFAPEMALNVGSRVHPTTPNGHVWECTGAGNLPTEEPTWIVDTETSQTYGTAAMIARPFYRPMVHGPVAPEVTVNGEAPTDPYYDHVIMLMHANGESGSTTFIDDRNGQNISAYGSPFLDSTQAKFGDTSVYLDGTNSYLRYGHVAKELATATSFTIEGWFNHQVFQSGQNVMFGFHSSSGSNRLVFTPQYVFGSSVATTNYDTALSANEWNHFAVTRTTEKIEAFLNGTKVLNVATTKANDILNSDIFTIGQEYDSGPKAGDFMKGWVDEFRVTKEIVRYTENFTPPTEPFPDSAPIWTPADLFQNGEAGAWYDPSDLTTLFQDAAGTVPVTKDGDPVRHMQDKSGNGVHLSHQTGLIYRSDGVKHWLELDGSGHLEASGKKSEMAFAHRPNGGFTGCYGVRYGFVSNPNKLYMLLSNHGGTSRNTGISIGYDDRSAHGYNNTVRCWVGNGPGYSGSYTAPVDTTGENDTIPSNAEVVYSEVVAPSHPTSTKRHRFRVIGGIDYETNPAENNTAPSESLPTSELNLGRSSEGTAYMSGLIYQIVLVEGELLEGLRGELEAYVASKTPGY